jgi:hypothetical protein
MLESPRYEQVWGLLNHILGIFLAKTREPT